MGLGQLIAGFWLIQVASKEEAIEWVKRCSGFGKGPLTTVRVAPENFTRAPLLLRCSPSIL